MFKEFNSVDYCLDTCTEHPVNVNSFVVRKSIVSYKTACLADFDIAVETINVTVVFPSKYLIALLPLSFPLWSFHYI